jgi:hypothetical protein
MAENEYIIIKDCLNRNIRLTTERLHHIQESHPELASGDLQQKVSQTLQYPEIILSSVSDESVELIYRYYLNTVVGDKWHCIVVKNLKTDFFIITLYYTDTIKKGHVIWKRT